MTAPQTIEFDPFSATYFDDPTEVYRALRDHRPVYRNDHYGFYALSRWDDVVEASRDWQTFTSERGIDLVSLLTGNVPEFAGIIMVDPPRHDRLRSLVSRVFTPKAVTALEPMVRDVIVEHFDRVDGRDAFDLVADVSALFPVEIISRMLGVPPEMRQQVRHWLDLGLTRQEGSFGADSAGIEAMMAMGAYFYELAVQKRTDPDDDMLSRLTQVTVLDDDGVETGLTDIEIAGFGALLGGAGAETVTKLVGNAGVLFDRHPDQWQLVLDDPDGAIPGAVEEVLRYYPPSQYQGRCTTRDVELHGEVIPAGSPVLLLTGAATHDERTFPDPERFDIGRPPALQVGFGHGPHSCLGAALARMESRIAFEELARRFPRFTVEQDGLRRVHMSNVAGYSHVPIQTHS